MNRKILERMKQSDYPAPELALRAQKLAELIVRECADVATINAHQWASPGTYVLKHFGVEE